MASVLGLLLLYHYLAGIWLLRMRMTSEEPNFPTAGIPTLHGDCSLILPSHSLTPDGASPLLPSHSLTGNVNAWWRHVYRGMAGLSSCANRSTEEEGRPPNGRRGIRNQLANWHLLLPPPPLFLLLLVLAPPGKEGHAPYYPSLRSVAARGSIAVVCSAKARHQHGLNFSCKIPNGPTAGSTGA